MWLCLHQAVTHVFRLKLMPFAIHEIQSVFGFELKSLVCTCVSYDPTVGLGAARVVGIFGDSRKHSDIEPEMIKHWRGHSITKQTTRSTMMKTKSLFQFPWKPKNRSSLCPQPSLLSSLLCVSSALCSPMSMQMQLGIIGFE